MAMKTINLGTLQDFDGGRVALVLDDAIKKAVTDCQDRPHLDKSRTVTLEISMEPVPPDRTGEVTELSAQFKVKASIPKFETRIYSVGVKKDGSMYYNQDSTDNIDQGTLLPDDDEK